jgi:predicted nucleotidyltransferase
VKIDRTSRIAGQRIKLVRDFLREIEKRGVDFGEQEICGHFKVEGDQVSPLIAELLILDLISPAGDRRYEVSERGGPRLANAKLTRRIAREHATEMLKAFLMRVEAVNARADLTHSVAEVAVFGSYADEAVLDVCDIDLALRLHQKQGGQAGTAALLARVAAARKQGRRFRNNLQQLHYGEQEVRLLLKGRNPYLSFHSFEELGQMGIMGKRIFPQ